MDWVSTLFGAVIGFVSSIGIIAVQRLFDRAGKLEIYAKVVYGRSPGSHTWGFGVNGDGVLLNVPIWIEIQNLSNSTRTLRDINLLLTYKGKELATMVQSDHTDNNGKDQYLFAEEGSYSLSIDGRKIKRIDCQFLLAAGSDSHAFDEIVLRFFDEKNRAHKYSLAHVEGDWKPKEFPRSREWKKLKEIK